MAPKSTMATSSNPHSVFQVENIRLSEKAKIQLITLKRKTGVQNWNVLCRWALCVSLAEGTTPPEENIATDSSVEMSWRTFAGKQEDVYRSIFLTRMKRDFGTLTPDLISTQFKLHLHRGIAYLASRVDDGGLRSMIHLVS